MECLVTGAAGFIGSHLCERLLQQGHRVIGVDCFTPYYPKEIKEANLAGLRGHRWFEFHPLDLRINPVTHLLTGVEWVFHLAAMPGLVRSWTHFDEYNSCNIVATQRLLESCREASLLNRFLYVSTSSVYGRNALGDETLPLQPSSPYGATKLAGEHLCRVYLEEFGLPITILRYFSVYGPRQRPDMGYHQFIQAVLDRRPIRLTGDGSQIRGNTYISDCVEATISTTNAPAGEILNVGGGEQVSMSEVIRRIEQLTGRTATIDYQPERRGDQQITGADITRLTTLTGWKPQVGITEGLDRQIRWHLARSRRAA
jgi:nucleoside-diphosphate-sugar epimerase